MTTPLDRALERIRMEIYQREVPPDDVTVRTIPLPPHVHGFVLPDPEDHYNIYLNSRDPRDVRQRTLEHELDHIRRGDAWTQAPVDLLDSWV